MSFLTQLESQLRDGFTRLAAKVPPPSDTTLAQMLVHAELLHRWNRTHNLTALDTANEWAEALYIDSWTVSALVPADDRPLLDIGAGGGFPSLVLLACSPEREAVLFEKVEKKRSFLTAAIVSMKLKRARVSREPFPPQRDTLPAAPRVFCSRATFAPSEWLALARTLAATGDSIIVQSSQEALAPGHSSALELKLPFSGALRRLGRYDSD